MWRWWLVLAVACGDNLVDERAVEHSGERLKRRWYVYEDGAREPGWLQPLHDVLLGTDCTLLEWADGIRRCTPSVFGADLYERAVYADPSCTTVMGRSGSVSGEAFFLDEWVDGEAKIVRAFEAGAILEPQPAVFFERRDGTCQGPLAVDARYLHYAVGRELSPAGFVAVTRAQLRTSGRIGQVVETSADGLSIWRGHHDHALDVACRLIRGPGDSVRCAPYDAPEITLFADPACSQPAVLVPADGPAPRFAFASSQDACLGYYTIGDRVDGPLYQQLGGSCVEAPRADGERGFRVREPLALASGDLDVVDAPGRRLHDEVAVFDGIPSPSIGLFDTQTHAPCSVLASGLLRCAPLGVVPADEAYVDAGCTDRRLVALVATGACQPTATHAASPTFGVHRIGTRVEVYGDPGCTPRPPPPGYAWHAVGDEIPDERFAPATLVIDP